MVALRVSKASLQRKRFRKQVSDLTSLLVDSEGHTTRVLPSLPHHKINAMTMQPQKPLTRDMPPARDLVATESGCRSPLQSGCRSPFIVFLGRLPALHGAMAVARGRARPVRRSPTLRSRGSTARTAGGPGARRNLSVVNVRGGEGFGERQASERCSWRARGGENKRTTGVPPLRVSLSVITAVIYIYMFKAAPG